MSIPLIQEQLKHSDVDGWLFFDFHGCNSLMWGVLGIPKGSHITRRIYYYVPKFGECIKIVSRIESHVLNHLPGKLLTYSTMDQLQAHLRTIQGRVAMEYSMNIPYISCVDGGTLDCLRSYGLDVVSSGALLQKLTSTLSDSQIASHREAAKVVSNAVDSAFELVKGELLQGNSLFEKDVQDFILNQFSNEGCVTDHSPIVARGANSANPHYAMEGRGDQIKRGDFLLIDLWCKKREQGSIFADITRVGCTAPPTEAQLRAFTAVREAQKRAVRLLKSGSEIRACDVDTVCREYLESLGYKENIFHRTGHNIHTDLHGKGANFDSFETFDDRFLVDKTCYSVEPALYFEGEFGVRLEHDVLYLPEVEVTGGVQDSLTSLL